jgi:hypothetical protein
VSSWRNPFEKLHHENPGFFRQGEVGWTGAPGWTPLVDGAFFHIHGELMRELHYVDETALQGARRSLAPELVQFVDLARSLLRQRQELDRVCGERLAVINALDAEVKELDRVCQERLAVINVLDAEAKRLAAVQQGARSATPQPRTTP